MRRYFVDAFYWIALLSHRDQWHRRVLAFDETLGDTPLYTTDEVLTEFLAFYAYCMSRRNFFGGRQLRV
jgi:hypothetical protein